MTIENLIKIIPPPFEKISDKKNEVVWDELLATTNWVIPIDYKKIVSLFGGGFIDEYLSIHSLSPEELKDFTHEPCRLLRDLRLQRDGSDAEALRICIKKEADPESVPYALYPEKNGLFPWASTIDGDILYWQWVKEHVKYRVVIWLRDNYPEKWEEYEMSITEFLTKLLSKKIESNAFPKDFPDDRPNFET